MSKVSTFNIKMISVSLVTGLQNVLKPNGLFLLVGNVDEFDNIISIGIFQSATLQTLEFTDRHIGQTVTPGIVEGVVLTQAMIANDLSAHPSEC